MSRTRSGGARHAWLRPLSWMICTALVMLGLAACGKTSSNSSTSSSQPPSASNGSTTPTASPSSSSAACGTAPTLPIKDSSGVLASLGATYRQAYNGYADPLFPSPYAHFKPKQSSGLTIGMVFTQPIDSFQAATIPLLQKDLAAISGVSHVTLLTAPPTGVATQIQQVNQLIQQHVSLIVAEPLVAQPFIPLAVRAMKAGIPFVSVLNGMATPDAVSVTVNAVADGATVGAAIAKLIGEKGTVIGVHGVPSTQVDQAEFAGYKAAFGQCPQIKFDSSIVGGYQVPVAKQAVLSYLSSHPQPVAGAVQIAGMGPGIIQAFQQTGRPQPALGDGEPVAGDLAYWAAHQSTFKAVAATFGPQDLARAVAYTAAHLLSGHGPKISEITAPSVIVTSSNLAQFKTPGAGPSSQVNVEGPAGSWLSDGFLAPLFNG